MVSDKKTPQLKRVLSSGLHSVPVPVASSDWGYCELPVKLLQFFLTRTFSEAHSRIV